MELTDAVLPLFGVVVGWALTECSSWFRWKREWRRKLNELRIETYAEWAAGMESRLVNYAHQSSSGSEYKTSLCKKRIQVIEHDPVALGLMREIEESIPGPQTEDFESLRLFVHTDPEWDWPPFREKMNELLAHVRRRMP